VITNHKIEKDILYIYFDFSYEFSKLGYVKEENIFESILKYIKNKKLKFFGQTILLCTSGIVFGTLNFNYEANTIDLNYNDANIEEIVKSDEENTIQEEIILDNVEKEENIKTEQVINPEIKNNNEINNQSNTVTNNTNTEAKKEEIKESIKEEKQPETKIEETKEQEELIEEVKYKTPVTIHKSNGEVGTLELEEYLIGVLAIEMPASFNMEALKAGAVAARTYALKHINEGKKLTDTELTQSYIEIDEMKTKWGNNFDKYYQKIKDAVKNTEGIYMTYNNYYIDAVYHSTSNGYTVSSIDVWGNDIPYLKSVDSIWDKNASTYLREKTISLEQFNQKLNTNLNENSNIEIIRDETNHVKTITIDDNTFTGIEFRTKLGLRSTDFDIKLEKENAVIDTKGYGHGVGMSQYGANEMAKLGYDYEQILKHYYTGITIKKLP